MRSVCFEKSGIGDLDQIVALRIAYLLEDHGTIPQEQMTKISEKLPTYFQKHLNNDLFVYTSKVEDDIVSCCFLLVTEKPSNLSFINGVVGTVMNVYTKPEYRRQWLAGKLLKMLLEDSEKMGLDFVGLKATNAGYNLYNSVGFKDAVSKYHNMKIVINSDIKI